MDLDRDGTLDIISGSYPGELYFFRGQEDGTFAESAKLQDPDGEDLNVGRAAALHVVDWDADGDLDLVVGDIRGAVWFLPNASGSDALEFGERAKLAAGDGDEPIRVGGGDAGPLVIDWNGDGTLDLVLGCGDGSVRFYANARSEGSPELAEPVELLAAPQGGMSLTTGQRVRCGARVKPAVVDWNGDGDLDLLLGDVLIERGETPTMDESETAEHERLQAKMAWISQRYGPAMQAVTRAVQLELGLEGEALSGNWYAKMSDDQKKRYRELHQEMLKQDITATALQRLLRETQSKMRKYRPPSTIHGHVWVMLRNGES